MVSSETYPFVSGEELHAGQAKTLDRGYLNLPLVPSTKAASWENINELELLNSAGGSFQGAQLPPNAHISFSNVLGGISVGHSGHGREGHIQMGSHFPGSNVHGEALETLRLMNPQYPGYPDTTSHGSDNMVLVNPSVAAATQDNSLAHHGQLSQHYFGFSSSSALAPSSWSHHSSASSVYNTVIVTQPQSQQASLFSHRFGTNTWATGSELSFLAVNDTARLTQPLAARLACMEPGQQQPSSSINQLIARPDENGSTLQHGITLGLTTGNPQASPASNQGLSLSLSAQHNPLQMQCYGILPTPTGLANCHSLLQGVVEDEGRDDRYSYDGGGDANELKNNQFASAYQTAALDSSRQLQLGASVQAVTGFRGYLASSKYLRVAQILLEEVVSLGSGVKNTSKHTKLQQSWMGGGSLLASTSVKEESALCESVGNFKEGVACVISATQKGSISGNDQNLSIIEHNLQENQELQVKKAKLIAMLDEVDRRYKLYFSQMEAVVNTFDSAAGLGAAKTYTALALQTISKHFRGLRDAIGSQIQAASRALGEEDPSALGLGRLRYVDQQLRQQQTLQHFGMIQHPWRPQRGLPERSVSVLRAWLFEHFLHPYPKDTDKHMLARQTGLTRNQVSNWFINARVRLWKPMVEEMYLEELKEAEMDRNSAETSTDQKSNTETSDNHRSGISGMEDQAGVGVPEISNLHGRDEVGSKDSGGMQSDKQMIPSYQHTGSSVLRHRTALDGGEASLPGSSMLQDRAALDGGEASLLQGIIKGRNAGVLDSCDQAFKAGGYERENALDGQDRHGFMMRGMDNHTLGVYQDQGEGFSATPAGYNGVTLTLGLQHSDGALSLASAHQQYYLQQQQNHLQGQGYSGSLLSQLAMAGSRRRLEEVEDYYACIDNAKNLEALGEMQSRKRFASNMYNEG